MQTTLQRGAYKLNLGEGCALSDGRWSLKGMIRRYLTATARERDINIPPLDIAAMMPTDITPNNSYQVHLDLPNSEYKPNYVGMNGDNDGYPEGLVGHHLSWTAIGLVIIIICVAIYVAIWVYRRRVKIRVFFADALFAKHVSKGGIENVKYDVKTPDGVQLVPKTESTDTEIV